MKNFSTWIILVFVAMFWIFRVVVAFSYELGINLGGIVPFNQTMEIILLFVVLICMVFIVKRKMIGALIYLLVYGMYFGGDLVTGINTLLNASSEVNILNAGAYLNLFISFLGILLPVAVMFDLLVDKNRKANPKHKQTDWFYNNKQFDRKLDERADKNNYRTM